MDCYTDQNNIEVRERDNERKRRGATNFGSVLETICRIYIHQI